MKGRVRRMDRDGIRVLLSQRIRAAEADEAIARAVVALGLAGHSYERDEVLAILDHLIDQGGLVSVLGRFAKARALLTLRPPDAEWLQGV